jgi:hypothetical protein
MLTENDIAFHKNEFDKKMEAIKRTPSQELLQQIADDKCPYPTQHLLGVPIGMFHCPLCGEMVLAGQEHGPRVFTDEELTLLANKAPDEHSSVGVQ